MCIPDIHKSGLKTEQDYNNNNQIMHAHWKLVGVMVKKDQNSSSLVGTEAPSLSSRLESQKNIYL